MTGASARQLRVLAEARPPHTHGAGGRTASFYGAVAGSPDTPAGRSARARATDSART